MVLPTYCSHPHSLKHNPLKYALGKSTIYVYNIMHFLWLILDRYIHAIYTVQWSPVNRIPLGKNTVHIFYPVSSFTQNIHSRCASNGDCICMN